MHPFVFWKRKFDVRRKPFDAFWLVAQVDFMEVVEKYHGVIAE